MHGHISLKTHLSLAATHPCDVAQQAQVAPPHIVVRNHWPDVRIQHVEELHIHQAVSILIYAPIIDSQSNSPHE